MQSKLIFPEQWFRDYPVAHLLDVHRNGIDRGLMQKIAAAGDGFGANIRPEKGFSFVHLITLGAGERYGCFFAGAPVSTIEGLRGIETIQVGDLVQTHKGRYRKVLNTFRDEYEGTKVSLTICGIPVPVESTENHPFLVIRKGNMSSGMRCYHKKRDSLDAYMSDVVGSAEFVAADTIQPGDIMFTPIGETGSESAPYPAYILGLYTADDCLFKEYRDICSKGNNKGVVFTLGTYKEPCIQEIQTWRGREGKDDVSVRSNGEQIRFEITHQDFAAVCAEIGSHAGSKRVPEFVFRWCETDRLKFIAGYLDGDGCCAQTGKESGSITMSTASLDLAMDMRRLCASVGLPMSVCRGVNKESNGCLGSGDHIIYAGSIPAGYASKLQPFVRRLQGVGSDVQEQAKQYICGGYILSKVTAVAHEDIRTTKYNIEVEEDNTYVVLVAGHNSNSNTDWFNKTAGDFRLPYPEPGRSPIYRMRGGMLEFHPTFMKYAHVYRAHVNRRKKAKPLGDVVAERYNDVMDRGELIVKLPDALWESQLQKLASGQQLSWSMGCGIDYDTCSYCGHQAPEAKDYCYHMKYQKHSMDSEGNQVFAINDQTFYHDISEVEVPSDRIALTLEKVASGLSIAEAVMETPSLPLYVVEKIGSDTQRRHAGLLQKLAEMEKQIQVQGIKPVDSIVMESFRESSELPEEVVKKMTTCPLPDLLLSLSKHKCMLSPKDFARVVTRKRDEDLPGLHEMPCELRSMFSTVSEEPEEIVSDSSYLPTSTGCWSGLQDLVKSVEPDISLKDEPVRKRVIISVTREPREKKASTHASSGAEAKVLAREYAKYQLSFLASGNEDVLERVLLYNQAQ